MQMPESERTFRMYKKKVETTVRLYTTVCKQYPQVPFPRLASIIWRYGMLAEMWGSIATALSQKGINYLDNWRQGK